MEPHHLLTIGLGNAHRKIDNLKLEVESQCSSSLGILTSSLTLLSSFVSTNLETINSQIGNLGDFKNGNTSFTNIVEALNYLDDSIKVNINLETEIENRTKDVLKFVDNDSTGIQYTHFVYTSNYIDTFRDSLYVELNKCYVNIMARNCYDESKIVSIIYGDSEYFYIDPKFKYKYNFGNGEVSLLKTYYLDSNGDEIEINYTSYGKVLDPKTNIQVEINLNDSANCIHIWHVHEQKPQLPNVLEHFKQIYHPIKVKIPHDPSTI